MKTKNLFLCCVAIFAGCATKQLDSGLKTLLGQNIQEAISRMGYPDGQREVLGDTLYIWSTNRNGVIPLSTTSTTTGSVGHTPVYGSTTSTQLVPISMTCTVTLATNAEGTIKHYQWEGNEAGCSRYAGGFR